MRPIDADALKKAFCNHCDGDEPCTEPCVDIGLIETAPTIDVVHGEWIWDIDGMDWGIGSWRCSKCHARPNTYWQCDSTINPLMFVGSSYCPNCGVKMGAKEGIEE